MSDVLYLPGRTTKKHEEFLNDHGRLEGLKVLVLESGTADLAYASNSTNILLCSGEKYILELHKFLLLGPAHRYVREKWEDYFSNGTDWELRTRIVAALNNPYRTKQLKNWGDIAMYYCLLAMSGFSVRYSRRKMIGEYSPITPDYDKMREWSLGNRHKEISYHRRNIYNFPTNEVDKNTLIYIHMPPSYGQYGYGYLWTQRKFKQALSDLTDFARMGHKVCVSFTHEKWGRRVNQYLEQFPTDVFTHHIYTELKASRYGFDAVTSSEAYVVANV